VYMYVTMLGQE